VRCVVLSSGWREGGIRRSRFKKENLQVQKSGQRGTLAQNREKNRKKFRGASNNFQNDGCSAACFRMCQWENGKGGGWVGEGKGKD